MITKTNRPADWTVRETLAAVIASAGRDLDIPDAFRVATNACRPLYMTKQPPLNWYPGISRDHAKAAIASASKSLADGGMAKAEYDFVCRKLRLVILRPLPGRQMTADSPETPNADTQT